MMANEVSIGRLVFDIPGLQPEQAARLAEQIGTGLAGLKGEFGTLSVTLDEDGSQPLAPRIVAALRQQIG
jgi:hypothetical protein